MKWFQYELLNKCNKIILPIVTAIVRKFFLLAAPMSYIPDFPLL